jgi:LacI family transcriptional regulator
MNVTLKDIAKKASVSVMTVSRVINDKPDVSDETRKKILKLINEFDYKPNNIARGLVMKKTHTIGLIIPDISNPFLSSIAKAIDDKAQKFGYSVIFANTDNSLEREKKAVELLRSKQVDGLVVSLLLGNKEVLDKFKKANYPVVQIDRTVSNNDYPLISIDNENSAYRAVEYLIKKGHKKIAHITGDLNSTPAIIRLKGYKKALADYNLKIRDNYIVEGNYTKEYGYQGMNKLLGLNDRPTAVFAANDMSAAGIYLSASKNGLSIPEDISVVGHDDVDIATLLKPELTTMRQPTYQLGEIAITVLLEMINNKINFSKIENRTLQTDLIIRESVSEI